MGGGCSMAGGGMGTGGGGLGKDIDIDKDKAGPEGPAFRACFPRSVIIRMAAQEHLAPVNRHRLDTVIVPRQVAPVERDAHALVRVAVR